MCFSLDTYSVGAPNWSPLPMISNLHDGTPIWFQGGRRLPGLCSVSRSEGSENTRSRWPSSVRGMQDALWLCCSFSPMVPNQLTFLDPCTVLLRLSSVPTPGLTVGFSWEKWVYTTSSVLQISLSLFNYLFSLLIFSQFSPFYIAGYFFFIECQTKFVNIYHVTNIYYM